MLSTIAQTTSLKLDMGELALVAGIVATVFAIIQGIIKFGDRLWGSKKKKDDTTSPYDRDNFPSLPTALNPQNIGCHIQHTELKSIVSSMSSDTQNAIREMAHNIDKFREVVQESHTAAEVRHATIIAKLDGLHETVRRN